MVTEEKVWQPDNLHDAWFLSDQLKQESCFVSGGTWLRTQWESGTKAVSPNLISLENIPDMKAGIYEAYVHSQNHVVIGALTTLSDVIKHPGTRASLLAEACRRIAAPSVRNQGTLGGNILTRTGDTLPSLLVMQARLNWFDGRKIVTETVEQWLRRKNSRIRILVSVMIPAEKRGEEPVEDFSFYIKSGRREAFIPSVVTVSCKGTYMKEKRTFRHIRLAAGGGNEIPARLKETEALLENSIYSKELLQDVYTLVRKEFVPAGDPFAAENYKRKTAANLIVSELYRTGGGADAFK